MFISGNKSVAEIEKAIHEQEASKKASKKKGKRVAKPTTMIVVDDLPEELHDGYAHTEGIQQEPEVIEESVPEDANQDLTNHDLVNKATTEEDSDIPVEGESESVEESVGNSVQDEIQEEPEKESKEEPQDDFMARFREKYGI